jgi:hypothetical protein
MDALRYLIVTGRTIARAEMVSKHDPYKTAYSGTSWMAS